MSSIARILHTATWEYFTSRLPYRFSRSPKVVKEAIMTDINTLVQDFWSSSDGGVGPPFRVFAMRVVCCMGVLKFWKYVLLFLFLRLPSST